MPRCNLRDRIRTMEPLPFEVTHELSGWALYWALLEPLPAATPVSKALAEVRSSCAETVRGRFRLDSLATEPAVAGLRGLFRAAGTDPTRYRPSSEALLRRLLKGGDLPAIHPLVDINNCLSALLPAPCCVMDENSIAPPFVFRSGRPGEAYTSFKGPFRLKGRPLLVDARGPCDAPITGSERVKVDQATSRAWLVAYLPAAAVDPSEAARRLPELLERAPVASVATCGCSI